MPTWTNAEHTKAGYRCPNRECVVAAVLIEVDITKARQDQHRQTPHLMTDASAPSAAGGSIARQPKQNPERYRRAGPHTEPQVPYCRSRARQTDRRFHP
jgi:hypothetical protein